MAEPQATGTNTFVTKNGQTHFKDKDYKDKDYKVLQMNSAFIKYKA